MKPRLYRTGDAWGCWLEGTLLGFGETAPEAYWHWATINKLKAFRLIRAKVNHES